jgi:hypothetical protein
MRLLFEWIDRIGSWRLWGVVVCGLANVLLYERGGDFFTGHIALFVVCLLAVPIAAGFVTPEKPFFTVTILTLGSVPPLNAISIVLWPFYFAISERTGWLIWLAQLPVALAFTMVAFVCMSVPYAALVYVGWTAQLEIQKSNFTTEIPSGR